MNRREVLGSMITLGVAGQVSAEPAFQPVDSSKVPGSFDASDWASEFCRVASSKGINIDEGWMITWFANALMRGYDEYENKMRQKCNEIAARCWCDPQTENKVMDVELAHAFGKRLFDSWKNQIRCPPAT